MPTGGESGSDDQNQLGREIAGRYRILAKLGEGGMGAVYRAEQISLKRKVALKVLKTELSADPGLVRRFNAEAELAAKLNHPNTVTLYDFGQDSDGCLFIAMEFIEGQSLRELMVREGPLSPERIVKICDQVCASLADAHTNGIVHRDLKPDNVMLSARGKRDDVVTVLDFGIAKLRDTQGDMTAMPMTQAGDLLGTPQYMAPEQIRGDKVDARTDVYALGAMIYEMITGRLPFEAPTLMAILSKHLMEMPVPPTERRADLDVPPALSGLVMSTLAKDPDARPVSMDQVADQLRALGFHAAPTLSTPAHMQGHSTGASTGLPSVVSAPPGVPRRLATPAPTATPAPIATPAPAAPSMAAPAPAHPGYRPPSGPVMGPQPAMSGGQPVAAPTPVPAHMYPPTPGTFTAPARASGSGGWIWILVAVLVIGGAGVGAFFAFGAGGDDGGNGDSTDGNKGGDGDTPSLKDFDVRGAKTTTGDGDETVAVGKDEPEVPEVPEISVPRGASVWIHPDLPLRLHYPSGFATKQDAEVFSFIGAHKGHPIIIYAVAADIPGINDVSLRLLVRELFAEGGGVVTGDGTKRIAGERRYAGSFEIRGEEKGEFVTYQMDSMTAIIAIGTTPRSFAPTREFRREFFGESVIIGPGVR